MSCLLAALAPAFAATPPEPYETPAHVTAWRQRVDWKIAGDEAVRLLSEYLQVDTRNPPGNEAAGVAWLGAVLDREGIAWKAIELEPGRSSLVARLAGAGKGPPLCLVHHVDVVTTEDARWPADKGPLSGAVADGAVWGRGAIDMKGMGAVELLTMAWIHRLGLPLDRDVVLLALADEEVASRGARQLATPELWKEIGCGQAINEGGIGAKDALFEGQDIHAISVAEKGFLWVEVVATGDAGHGSTPRADEAPERLVEAMNAITRYDPAYRVDDSLYTTLSNAGHQHGGFAGAVMKSRFLVRTLAWPRLKANPAVHASLYDTLHLTGMKGAHEPNVVPSEVSAVYDCRLLPGTTPEVQLERLRKLVKGIDGIELRVIGSAESNGSPVDDPLFRAIAHYATEDRPHAVAGPLLSTGYTDSLVLRPLGVNAYGYLPFTVTDEELAAMHGHGERVPVEEVHEGLRRLFSMVVDVAASQPPTTPSPPPAPPPPPNPE